MSSTWWKASLTDVESYSTVLRGADMEIAQLEPGPLRGHHMRVGLPGGEISWVQTNLPLRGGGRFPSGLWTLSVITRTASRSLQHGVEVRTGSLIYHRPGEKHDGIYGRDFSVVCLCMREYVRAALKNGLALEQKLGINPYKFGLVGSTDSHTALSTAAEDNFFGKASIVEPNAHRWEHPYVDNKKTGLRVDVWRTSASGIAAVWAKENTREAIFDAMQRRETYATTGSRMLVRFFGGWDFQPGDANNRMPGQVGYTKGVPMGGDLHAASAGKAPTFLVAALKDPMGANLDRYQIIKGWLDAKGEVHEKIYDVAVSGGRKIDADGRCKTPVGNTVDVENATWSNTIGAPELIAVWKDPDFDPAQKAFYYGRVIEIPTPRWTAYDARRFGVKMTPEVPMTVTDRAYTSPIWYTPGK